MVNELTIQNYFQKIDLDVRKTGDGTWIDQKCAMDVVSYVADCILMYVAEQEENGNDTFFSIKDIMSQKYSSDNIIIFGKRRIELKDNEYDKFFSHPIKMFLYARVLEIDHKKGRQFFFNIKEQEFLEYIAQGDRKALTFLQVYIKKVLSDSGIYEEFETFWREQDEVSYSTVKEKFWKFMIRYTKKGSKGGDGIDECNRIFIKIINPLSYLFGKKGTEGGYISKDIIQYNDLQYNRKNFRDIATEKTKNVSRKEHEKNLPNNIIEARVEYEVAKAKRNVKRHNKRNNSGKSECVVFYSTDIEGIDVSVERQESEHMATQMHHIFPRNEKPEIAAYVENIIALSPNQHVLYAHPEGKTRDISSIYQYYLLLSKVHRISKDTTDFYSFDKMLHVLKTGLDSDEFLNIDENDFIAVIEMIKQKYK